MTILEAARPSNRPKRVLLFSQTGKTGGITNNRVIRVIKSMNAIAFVVAFFPGRKSYKAPYSAPPRRYAKRPR